MVTDHPYQPGTVWAPKKGGRERFVVQSPRRRPMPNEVWYQPRISKYEVGPARGVLVVTFARWAGEQIK